MKKLRNFLKFDSNAFLKDKTLMYLEGKIQDDDHFKGAKITTLIIDDRTDYGDDSISNQYEKLSIKVPNANEDYLRQFKRNEEVRVIDVSEGKVWGDYGNNLTITGKLIKINKGQ